MHDQIDAIMENLRPRDAAELAECGLDVETAAAAFRAPCVLMRIFAHRGGPAAVVAFHALNPSALVVSMAATQAWPKVARHVVRWAVREARPALLAKGFMRAECRTIEGHDDAIRLLERLGFVRECRLPDFGATGAPFLQYAWRLNDHVFLQSPEGPAAAPAPAGGRVQT